MTEKKKQVKTHVRHLANGKSVVVRQHSASYKASDKADEVKSKKGAGKDYDKLKSAKDVDLDISLEDFKEWYSWDTEEDPNNSAAKSVEKKLIKLLGKKGYKEFYDKMTDSWTPRGAKKAFDAFSKEQSERKKKQDAEIASASKDIFGKSDGGVQSSSQKSSDTPTEKKHRHTAEEIKYFEPIADKAGIDVLIAESKQALKTGDPEDAESTKKFIKGLQNLKKMSSAEERIDALLDLSKVYGVDYRKVHDEFVKKQNKTQNKTSFSDELYSIRAELYTKRGIDGENYGTTAKKKFKEAEKVLKESGYMLLDAKTFDESKQDPDVLRRAKKIYTKNGVKVVLDLTEYRKKVDNAFICEYAWK